MNGHQPQLFPQDVPWELDAQATSTVARIVFSDAPHGRSTIRCRMHSLEHTVHRRYV